VTGVKLYAPTTVALMWIKDYHRAVGAILCEVVDDAAFKRDDFQQKDAEVSPSSSS